MKLKRLIAFVLTLALSISLVGCNKKTDDITIVINKTDSQKEFENYASSIIREYISLRIEIEKLANDEDAIKDKEGMKTKLDELILRCNDLEAALSSMDKVCDLLINEKVEWSEEKLSLDSNKVYAAESSDKVKEWAEDIQNAFDSYPQGKQLKGLAGYLKTDVATAKKAFDAAMGVLQNEAMEDEQYAQDMMDRFKGIQAVCKAEMFVASCALGEFSSALEAGAFVVGGVDTIIGLEQTGCEILIGDDHALSQAFSHVKDKIAPLASITGLVTLSSANDYEVISYYGDAVVDFLTEGKILGGTVQLDPKEEKMKIWTVEVADLSGKDLEKEVIGQVESKGAKITSDEIENVEISKLPDEVVTRYETITPINEIPAKMEKLAEKIEAEKANLKEDKNETKEVTSGGAFSFELDPSCESWPRSTNLDQNIYFAFRNVGMINVTGDSNGYSFTVPEYTYSQTEGNSTQTITIPEMSFVSSEITDEKIVFTLISDFESKKVEATDAGNNSHTTNYTFTINNGSFTLKVNANKIPKKSEKIKSEAKFEGSYESISESYKGSGDFVYGQSYFSNSYIQK